MTKEITSNTVFQTVNTIAVAAVIIVLSWIGATLTNLNTQVAVLISQNVNTERRITEHVRMPVHRMILIGEGTD